MPGINGDKAKPELLTPNVAWSHCGSEVLNPTISSNAVDNSLSDSSTKDLHIYTQIEVFICSCIYMYTPLHIYIERDV